MLNLTAYFDESGHADDPNLNFVGMAGFVAPLASWINFEDEWRNVLDIAGLKEPFHMKDFAHSEGQFKSWKKREEKRQPFLRRLMEIISATGATPIGSAVSLRDFFSLTPDQQSQFRDPYYVCFQTCTRGAAIKAVFEDAAEKLSMVYAFQKEYGTDRDGRAQQLWESMKQYVTFAGISERMGSYASGSPSEMLPLQAADLFAYELCHEFENHINRPNDRMRWGLRQILQMYKTPVPFIRLFDRRELLRLALESQMPDQTGVEEISASQIDSSRQQMNDWLMDRGEFSPEDGT
jgi:uncharacterized protein DUF3800